MSKIKKVIDLLKMAGIDYSKIAGKVDPNVTKLVTKTQETARKPKLIDALNKKKATYQQALDIFENDAKYISQMNEMELVNFANNLDDYFKVGGEVKYRPSNVVTPEGTPVVGKKLETLAERKGAKGKADDTSLRGAMEGLMTLVDEIKGISPKMRNQMDRDELVEFIRKMRGRDFTNQEIKLVREYMDEWGIGLAKEKAAPAMAHAKKLGAKDKEEFKFIEEYLDDIQTTSPKDFREMYGNVKNINMKLSEIFDAKLEKHFKKKYKWDDTKRDGGLDDATFEKYEDELYDAQKEFGDFHRVYDTDVEPGMFGVRKSTSWAKNPKEYLDEASEQLKSITGEGLNTNFWKNYTEEVLGKYPKPEKFQYGGLAGMLGEPTYQDDNHRMPYNKGGSISDVLPPDFDELDHDELMYIIKLLQTGEIPQYASGGRIGFSEGKGPKMSRRNFLKIMGGLAALPVVGKFFKLAKPAAKVANLTQVPIENAKGMPSWFKPLVNRVIKEGVETTNLAPNKGGAYLERQIVHSAKLGEGQGVRVYQNLDDQTINVEYQSVDNLGGVDDGIVNLEYRAPQDIYDTGPAHVFSKEYQAKKKAAGGTQYRGKSAAEFEAHEAYPYQDPKDYKTVTFEGDNIVKNVNDLHSDTSALKQFATGKDLTKKELAIAKQKKSNVKKINEDPWEELAGSGPDYDPYASGGRVSFKWGGKGKVLEGLAKLMDEFFPGTTKIGQRSKPYPEKVQETMDLRKAIAEFQERENVIIDGKKYKRSDKDRPPTEEELEDDYAELWDDENSPLDFGSTVRELDAALVDRAEEYKYMYQQYKMGKLDPEAGSVSRARLNLLRKRAEEAENTKDFRLFGEDEADELDYLEDHFAQVDKEESFQFAERARKAKEKAADKQSPWYTDPKTLTPEEELRREFPGISDDLIKNILADDNPQRIAEVKATLKEALKMQEKGMSPEEIINIFKKKPTKHATGGRVSLSTGGLAGMLGE